MEQFVPQNRMTLHLLHLLRGQFAGLRDERRFDPDFADVVPLRGVIFGGGDQVMDVEVSVIPT